MVQEVIKDRNGSENASGSENVQHFINSVLMNNEILRIIGEFLPLKSRLNARSVCKLWNKVISSQILVNLRSEKDILSFSLLRSQISKDEEEGSSGYFTKFNLIEFQNLKTLSWLEVSLMFHQIMKISQIKELILPQIDVKVFCDVLKVISPTIQKLIIELPLFPTDTDADSEYLNNEDKLFLTEDNTHLILENLNSLVFLKTERKDNVNEGFLKGLLKSCYKIKELGMKHSVFKKSFELVVDWIIENRPELKVLELPHKYMSEDLTFKLIRIVEEDLVGKVEMENATLVLSKENISDFFHLEVAYNTNNTDSDIENKYPRMSQKSVEILKKKIQSIYSVNNRRLNKVLLKDFFFHFPDLKRLIFIEDIEATTILTTEFENPKKINGNKIESFCYSSFNDKLPMAGVDDKISQLFPNLTSLTLIFYYNETMKLDSIFNNLKKLKTLMVVSSKNGLFGDELFIGIPRSVIEKMFKNELVKWTFKELNEVKDGIKLTVKPSIALLQDLTKVHIEEQGHSEVSISSHKFLTELFLFFGARLLPKLKCLYLLTSSMKYMKQEHWAIFKEDFLQLESLQLPVALKNYEILQELKWTKPNLDLKFR